MASVYLVLILALLAAVLGVAGVAVLFGHGWALITAAAFCAAAAAILRKGLKANA